MTWSDDWLLGIDALDSQHKVLADSINRLVVECKQAQAAPPEEVEKRKVVLAQLVNDLYTTTKKHFSFEEALMRDEGYPSYAAHAREHVMLIAELKATFINGLTEGRCNLKPDILQALKSWLIVHVSHSDRDFANFLREKHRSRPAAALSNH
jgi:hemerythrin